MKKLNPAYVEAIKPVVNNSPFFSLISMEIKNLEPGHTRLEVILRKNISIPLVGSMEEFFRLW